MIFRYRAYDENGKKTTGSIESASIERAIEAIEAKGLVVEHVKEQRSFFKRQIDPALLANLSKNLSLYLKSGISIARAIGMLKHNYEHKKRLYLFLQQVEESIKKGDSLHNALRAQHYYTLPSFYLYTIDVSEKVSGLHSALEELSDLILRQEKIKREVVKAFIYPTFIILIAIGIVNFMLTSIVPKIVDMFAHNSAELPAVTKVTLALSSFVQQFGWFMTIGGVGSAVFIYMAYKQVDRFSFAVDGFMLKIPLIKDVILSMEIGRFSNIASLLLDKGIPYTQAIKFASNTFGNEKLKRVFLAASDEIVRGKSLTNSLAQQTSLPLPKDFINAVAVGEESSHLSYSLKMIAGFFEQKNKDKVDILLALLEPVLMLLVGGVVGFLVISMMLPIFSLSIS